MPNPGFTSITCRTEIHDDIRRMWRENRKEMGERGITTFSDFFVMLIHAGMKKEGLEMPARSGA